MESQLRYESCREFVDATNDGSLNELLELLECRSINGVCIYINTPEKRRGHSAREP